jgi:hypothetical protein
MMATTNLKQPTLSALVHYDRARSALTRALESTQVETVLQGRIELDLIKRRARQIQDRELLADATEFQMRIERHLGTLLQAATAAGQLRTPGQRGHVKGPSPSTKPATLSEIGVDPKLSMKARQAAKLKPEAFTAAVSEMRIRLASGNAKVIDTVHHAEKTSRGKSLDRSAAEFRLLDGTAIGQVKIGRLRFRIASLRAEARLLDTIANHSSNTDGLATISESVSEQWLAKLIVDCERERSAPMPDH